MPHELVRKRTQCVTRLRVDERLEKSPRGVMRNEIKQRFTSSMRATEDRVSWREG